MFDFLDADGALADVFRSIAMSLPKFGLFVAVLAVGWLVARLARKLCVTVLARVGFPGIVERSGLSRFLARGVTDGTGDPLAARADLDATMLIARLVFVAVLLFAAQIAFGIWGPNPVSALISDVVAWLPRAAVAIVIVAVAAALAQGARRALVALLGGTSYGRPVAGVARLLILGIGIVAALNQIGVAESVTTPLLIAVLATVSGVLIVGAGGGLIRPMQHRWERILISAEAQARTVSTSAQAAAYLAGHTDAATAPLATHQQHHHAMSAASGPGAAPDAMSTPSAAHQPVPGGWPTLHATRPGRTVLEVTRTHPQIASLMARLGEVGLAAAAVLPGLLAELDQHVTAVREALGRDGRPPATLALAGYAEGVRDAAAARGWRAPDPHTLDWTRADWAVLRLVAAYSLTHP